jgi:hypothetical protein
MLGQRGGGGGGGGGGSAAPPSSQVRVEVLPEQQDYATLRRFFLRIVQRAEPVLIRQRRRRRHPKQQQQQQRSHTGDDDDDDDNDDDDDDNNDTDGGVGIVSSPDNPWHALQHWSIPYREKHGVRSVLAQRQAKHQQPSSTEQTKQTQTQSGVLGRSFATFHEGRAFETLLRDADVLNAQDFNRMANVSLRRAQQNTATHWHYFTSDLRSLPKTMLNGLHALRVALFNPFDNNNDEDGDDDNNSDATAKTTKSLDEHSQINVWIGGAGLVTHAHLDAELNLFTQIRGRKRFTLLSPQARLRSFPCLHPHTAHAYPAPRAEASLHQVTSDDSNSSSNSSKVLIAELGRGDMLFVPAYYWHHVETLTDSVSLNVWTDAAQHRLSGEIYSTAIPFETSWPVETTVLAAHLWLRRIATALFRPAARTAATTAPSQPLQRFVRDWLLQQRYAHLVESGALPVDEPTGLPARDMELLRGVDALTTRLGTSEPGRQAARR